jgi:hypothetical protein
MEFIKGPLGSHRNYIRNIVLPNIVDYFGLQKENEELNSINNPSKYKELRFFLNAIESTNNILDYYFYENESSLKPLTLKKYKLKIQEKIPIFVEVADLANAYKHCVRENGKGKNSNLPWAKDLQQPKFTVNIQIPNGEVITKKEQIVVQADYDFSWPIDSHEKAITEIFQLLIKYENSNELMFNIV